MALMFLGCGMEPSNTDLGLRVVAEVEPRELRLSDSAAAVRIRVLVGNPGDVPVLVPTGGPPYRVLGDPTAGPGRGFGYRIASATSADNAGPAADWWGGAVDTFPPGRTRFVEHTLMLQAWQRAWAVAPGEYRIRSFYHGREGASAVLRVRP